ncbi:MAG: PorV/PorQ family protein [Flavobacteriales bacterium]|nr:PorV/PorQ family protein [Flavobacteriales bacterium]
MKISKYIISLSTLAAVLLLLPGSMSAGNPDRAGSAGASQLLINPWARSTGMANASMASIRGVEATFLNVAGLAFVERTELIFANQQYLVGTDITMNSLGFGQKVGENSVIALTVMSMSFGEIDVTTEDLPEGGIGTFRPNMSNIGISYAKAFSNSIYGGITARIVSESISNARAQGIAFDAGIRYITGDNDQLRFGIALRNVGPPMRFSGDGLTATATIPSTGNQITVSQRSEKYELPSMVNIGVSYDFLFSETMKLTTDGQFTSNSFTRDQFGFGAAFSWNERVIIRGGYLWESELTNEEERQTAVAGPGGGLTLQIPAGPNGTVIGVDYSYRTTNPFNGTHAIGLHVTL